MPRAETGDASRAPSRENFLEAFVDQASFRRLAGPPKVEWTPPGDGPDFWSGPARPPPRGQANASFPLVRVSPWRQQITDSQPHPIRRRGTHTRTHIHARIHYDRIPRCPSGPTHRYTPPKAAPREHRPTEAPTPHPASSVERLSASRLPTTPMSGQMPPPNTPTDKRLPKSDATKESTSPEPSYSLK